MGKEDHLRLYKKLVEVRAVDLMVQKFYVERKLKRAYLFSGMGQEAAGVALVSALKKEDHLFPHYRGYSYLLAKNTDRKTLIATLLMKSSGAGMGIMDNSTYYDVANNIWGHSNFLGENFAHAVGLGLAVKRQKKLQIVLCAFGDGGSTRSLLSGALNLSSLWGLPIVWVCENNNLSISTSFTKISASKRVADLGIPYGIPSETISGLDPIVLYEKGKKIIEETRTKSYPFLLEVTTERILPHSLPDMYFKTPPVVFPPTLAPERDPLEVTVKRLEERGTPLQELQRAREEIFLEVGKEFIELLSAEDSSMEAVKKFFQL